MACVGVSADIGFAAPSLDSLSLCGFTFPPRFVFNLGFRIPGFKLVLPTIPFPWITLNCDLNDPISAGWGGGRMPQFDVSAFDECNDSSD